MAPSWTRDPITVYASFWVAGFALGSEEFRVRLSDDGGTLALRLTKVNCRAHGNTTELCSIVT